MSYLSWALGLIESEFSDKTDSKGTPYMWHIEMGLHYLHENGMTKETMAAFCIHPLVQDLKNLEYWLPVIAKYPDSSLPLAFALEYRNQANQYSTHNYDKDYNDPTWTYPSNS